MLGRIAFGAMFHEEIFLVGFWTSSNPIWANRLPERWRQLDMGYSSLLQNLFQVLKSAVESLVISVTRFIKNKPKSKIGWSSGEKQKTCTE